MKVSQYNVCALVWRSFLDWPSHYFLAFDWLHFHMFIDRITFSRLTIQTLKTKLFAKKFLQHK